MPEPDLKNRRPLNSRSTGWASMAAKAMLAVGLTPNAISMTGIGFAALGAWAFVAAPGQPWLYLAAAFGIQLRLLCNMLDGMVAVEGGKASATGPLYNEAPDRIEDALLLVAAGYATPFWWIGWLAALLAFMTAYVRALGGSFGFEQDFRGPMAKPHRMAALTLGCLLALAEALFAAELAAMGITISVLGLVMIFIATATAITCINRLVHISNQLRENAA